MKSALLIKKLILIILTISLGTMFLIKPPVYAQSLTIVSVVNPQTDNDKFVFYSNASPIEYRFNATVWIHNVTDLFAYQVYLTYNSTLLSATNAWLPAWDTSWVFYGRQSAMPPPMVNTVDWVKIGDSLLEAPTFNGTGLLAIIEFKIVGVPPVQGKVSSDLGINNTDTYLLDFALGDIAAVKTNGSYEYNWVTSPNPRFEVSPSQVDFGSLPPWAVGQETDIRVLIRSSYTTWHLTNATFSLNFNASLLAVVAINVDPFWNQSTINNVTTPGQIRVAVGRLASAAHGDVSVISVTFRVIYQRTSLGTDVSNITLQRTQQYWLLDDFTEVPVDQPINGRITINGLSTPIPMLSVSPSLVELGPQRIIGEQFDLQIRLKGLDASWNLSNVAIRLGFNSTMVEPLGVTAGPFLGQFGNSVTSSDIEANQVNIRQTLQNNVMTYPNGEGLIATVTFTVTYQKTVLETRQAPFLLNASLLQDNENRSIPLEITNGIYRISSLDSTSISVTISPLTAEVGSDVTISGYVTPIKANANVSIYYRLNTTQNWTKLGSVRTDTQGNFTYIWKTAEANAGEYQIKAEQSGDETTYPASSSVKTVSLASKPPPFNKTMLILIALLVLAIAGITMGAYMRKRRGQRGAFSQARDKLKG